MSLLIRKGHSEKLCPQKLLSTLSPRDHPPYANQILPSPGGNLAVMSQDSQVSGLSSGQGLPDQHLVRQLSVPELFSSLRPSHLLFPWPRRFIFPGSPSSHLWFFRSEIQIVPCCPHLALLSCPTCHQHSLPETLSKVVSGYISVLGITRSPDGT